jgi:hypothetical protein
MKITPIQGEIFRYWCQSSSNPEAMHLVDLVEGACGCADYTCRARKHKEATGKPYRCRHITLVREHALNEIIKHVREQL